MERRYDIDWLRVIAIGLLLIYHIAISFQPWGLMIGFITTDNTWESLWLPMAMLNVWRIPFLFVVSGMGVYFAMQRRSWSQLIGERTRRILVPFLFGAICIVPISNYLFKNYFDWSWSYMPNPGHLWFLGNIFVYVLLLSPMFFYLRRHAESKTVLAMKKVLGSAYSVGVLAATFVLEVTIVNPSPFEMYAMTWHGFFIGLICFFFGFCFVLSGEKFLAMILKGKWAFLALASGLFAFRLIQFYTKAPGYLLAIESACWIYSVLAFGYRYLRFKNAALQYLSKAAYPVYILHMIFLSLGSILIFKMHVPAPVQFVLLVLFATAGCFAGYEIVRRIPFVRSLFGIERKKDR